MAGGGGGGGGIRRPCDGAANARATRSCRELLQCVLADLLNRLSYAVSPVCTVTTA